MKIKFGTDGWRAIIAKEFTTENVARVTYGVVAYLKDEKREPKVVLGFDCRFGGKLFAETVAEVLSGSGIQVICCDTPTTTPAVSLATVELNAGLGIILTASHNPASYNGYKLKGHFGGPLLSEGITKVEALIPDVAPSVNRNDELIEVIDLNQFYIDYVHRKLEMPTILKSKVCLAYDAMYGSGQFVLPKLLPNAKLFRNEWNPHFYGLSPEPIMRNLEEFQHFLKKNPGSDLALINDGDADRIGLMDGNGNFIDSHHIMLLLLHYFVNYKGMKGRVATGFSSTQKIKQFCAKHQLHLDIVPIGFKHICELMTKHDILMGGEESGGIAVAGHIPERDGIWNGLILTQMLVETKKTINQLLQEIGDEYGAFFFKRIDLTLPDSLKNNIVANCKSGLYRAFGELKVDRVEDLDGWKYYLNDDEWVMIRASGTEPVLRTYAEGRTEARAEEILAECHKSILPQ
ncbi:MAG: phosphoglucomutase/phosphomannomutase family protein [Flavobacteriales bacterium]|nr:phosphoglucomutase/phosphomannomutase family protein [Flavobacteriales bacterium]